MFLGIPRLIVRGAANTEVKGNRHVVAVNADKIIFLIQNVSSTSLKGAENYVPHPLYVTFTLCFFLSTNLSTKTSQRTLIGYILLFRN